MIHGLTEYCLYLPRFSFLSLPPLLFLPLFFFFENLLPVRSGRARFLAESSRVAEEKNGISFRVFRGDNSFPSSFQL